MNNESKCCEKCRITAGINGTVDRCSNPACECHIQLAHTPAPEDWEGTPRWMVEAKYPAVLQIVLAANDWESKYPALEHFIASEKAAARREGAERAITEIQAFAGARMRGFIQSELAQKLVEMSAAARSEGVNG